MSLIQHLSAALLLALASHVYAAPPTEVRIAVVSYTAAGKQNFAGSVGIINREGELERELAKRGVKLTWVPVSTAAVGPQVNEAFSNGSIDFAGYGDLPSVIVNAAKVPTKLLVPSTPSNTYLVVPANSTVKSIKDLKGKRVALMRGRPWEYPFVKLLQANGMQLSDVRVVNLNPQAGAAAVSAGSVDAFFTLSDAWLLVDKGLARIVWDSKNSPASWQMRAELWGAQSFVQANPELTQLVVDAFVKNARWSSDPANKEELIRLGANAGLPESVIRRDYDNRVGDYWKERNSPLFTPALAEHYRDLAVYAKQSRLIPGDVDILSTFEPRFVQSAIQRFKLDGYWSGAPK
jgi:sulfonate transport system substrate-binding protein